MFRSQAARYAGRDIFYVRRGDRWRAITWDEVSEAVSAMACGLRAKGLSRGAAVAIFAGNVPEWTISDLAAIAAGGVGVGLYPTSSPEQCEYIIRHSEAEFIVVDTAERLEKIRSLSLPKVKEIFVTGAEGIETGGRISRFETLLEAGRSSLHLLPEIKAAASSAAPDDTAIIVYTSGTTGRPKGAMLSHRYILNSVESLRQSVPIFDTDIAMSYLPGCHVAERISGIYNRLYNATPAYFVDDLQRLYDYMLEARPTVFASLPRFFEKIHALLLAQYRPDEITPEIIRAAFGGRIRLLTSGGAPLPQEIADFFAAAGLPILEAYGLTENICVAFNTEKAYKYGTVGRPMPMCRVRIAGDGEIEVKSEMMFSGYLKAPEETAAMFTDDGWLRTGDLGSIDEDGFLSITGRKKELIILSSGKNIAPSLLENLVRQSHVVSHCFVYGDGKNYLVALVTLNEAEFAGKMSAAEARKAAAEAVDRANKRVSRAEQIKRFRILDEDFSIARGEVTPTGKLCRDVIARNYREILEELYEY